MSHAGDPEIGSMMPSWQRVMDLWDAGLGLDEICTVTGFSMSFVRSITCNLDEREDGSSHTIREATMLLGARIAQCFPHRPDMRRRAA